MSNLEVPNGNNQSSENNQGGNGRPPSDSSQNGATPPGRGQAVFIRNTDEVAAMSQMQRVRVQWKIFLRRICCQQPKHDNTRNQSNGKHGAEGADGGSNQQQQQKQDQDKPPAPQYRLEATKSGKQSGFLGKIASCCCGSAVGTGTTGIGINHNQRLASSLHWMFRVNFIFLFAVMCSIFFVWVMIFAGFIIAAGKMDNECVRIGGEPFADATSQFADAFALSWTTFSTVGYGSTYPALGHENDNPSNCLFITIICSLESFLGVLYSGFCGAILFGKVLRIQSHAQVVFSDPIVIRYGSGVQQTSDENDSDDEESTGKKIPCPVLEFRVVNRLFGETGGEIMDATLNCVANVDANDADPSLRDALDGDRTRLNFSSGKHESRYTSSSHPGSSTVDSLSDNHSDSGRLSHDSRLSRGTAAFFDSLIRRQHNAVDEDPSASLVNKRIFSKMMIEAGEHPFFKRVWLARHVLDDTSPIVKPKVRRQIQRNNGYWPERLNNYQKVRESLQFNQILVSLNGVSNVSASDVYAQKIYDYVDINVGYQFVNILYKDADGNLKVDTDLINDVREQKGGGGEPLIIGE